MNFVEFDFWQHLPSVLPEIALTALVVILVLMDSYLPKRRVKLIAYTAAIAMFVIGLLPLLPPFAPAAGPNGDYLFWGGMIRNDTITQIFRVMISVGAAITCLMAVDARGVGKGEFYSVVTVAALGASLLAASADLIMAFVALETMSISMYCLAGFKRTDGRSSESGMKYFLFGSFASSIMLFGFSLLYGFSGQTNLYSIASFFNSADFSNNPVPMLAALVMVIVGFGFKISAVPFHFWTPDVYEGAPTPTTAFLSVVSKAASFALVVRFFTAVFPPSVVIGDQVIQNFWVQFASAAAVISMTFGNVVALVQRNVKRLLAYSSIAQAGYTLIGVAALQLTTPSGQAGATAAIAFYMFMYTFTNLLAFIVIVLVGEKVGSENVADLAGLNRRNPWLALVMTIALLSLGGVPPAAGFFGKFFLFTAAIEADLTWLAIIGVLNSIIALYYYLIVIKVMYVDHGVDEDKPIAVSSGYLWAIAISTVAVVVLGTFGAGTVYEWVKAGAQVIFEGAAQAAALLPR